MSRNPAPASSEEAVGSAMPSPSAVVWMRHGEALATVVEQGMAGTACVVHDTILTAAIRRRESTIVAQLMRAGCPLAPEWHGQQDPLWLAVDAYREALEQAQAVRALEVLEALLNALDEPLGERPHPRTGQSLMHRALTPGDRVDGQVIPLVNRLLQAGASGVCRDEDGQTLDPLRVWVEALLTSTNGEEGPSEQAMTAQWEALMPWGWGPWQDPAEQWFPQQAWVVCQTDRVAHLLLWLDATGVERHSTARHLLTLVLRAQPPGLCLQARAESLRLEQVTPEDWQTWDAWDLWDHRPLPLGAWHEEVRSHLAAWGLQKTLAEDAPAASRPRL